MNIKEAEKLSGVSSRNIRFYEQKGLMKPSRNAENDYREYTEEEIQRLKLIRALRMVDMPLEQIREVIDGKVPLRTAATAQKEKLEDQIKHLKTVVKFCAELSETEPENISEVLTRMDSPENRKLLSSKWTRDHSEIAQNLFLSFIGGALFVICAWIAGYFLLLLDGLMQKLFEGVEAPLVIAALLVVALWGYCGYKQYEKKWWWIKCILIHIIPASVLLLSYYALEGNLFMWTSFMFFPYPVLQEFVGGESFRHWNWNTMVVCFWSTVGVFCLGMLLGRLSEIWQNAVKAKNTENPLE